MFKDLKDKVAAQVKKTNQTLLSTILSTDLTPLSRDSGTRTSSITSLENNRSRIDSASSDISNTNYVSPSRHFMPPSDIELEYGNDESDHETNSKMQKLLAVYKNKFTQLKNAYDEVEREKEQIKNILQQQQDTSIKRQTELREQIKLERQTKEKLEKEIKLRDNKIEELLISQTDQEEIRNLREKNTELKILLTKCKEAIKIHQEKQVDLIKERDEFLQQLNEKQILIESMMKDRHSKETSAASLEVKEHFDSDISVLLHDKERLQEELESARLYIQQLELVKQQQIKSELDEKLINDKLNLEIKNKEFQDLIKIYQENIHKDKQQIEQLNNEIQILKENFQSFDILKTEYENLTNELHQIKQMRDNIQSLFDKTNQERTMYKDKYEQIQQHEHTDDQIKVTLTKLQHDYDESLANCAQLTQKLDIQHQEHLEEIAKLSQIEDEHQKTIEILKIDFENTRKEQLSILEDKSSQIIEYQEEINRLKQLLNEQKNKSNQYEEELKEKSSQIIQLEKDLEKFKSQKQVADEYNSLKEQYQQIIESNMQKTEQLTTLQNELEEKIVHINNIEKQFEEKQNKITQLNTSIDELKATIKEHEQFRQTIETSQINDRQLLEQKDKTIDTLKQELFNQQSLYNSLANEQQDYQLQIEKLNKQHQQIIEEKTNDNNLKLEQAEHKIKELESACDSYRNEIETLKSEIISLININEENTRRIDEFDNNKFNFEQEINEKDRQITERDEKIQEIELTLKQTQESGNKLREALKNMNGHKQTNIQDTEIRLRKLTEEYEQRLKEQEIEYNTKLKAMAKEMSTQIEEKEQNYNQQLNDFIQKNYKIENDLINNSERRVTNAEQRALVAEEQMSKMQEELKEKQLDHHQIVQDLQNQIQNLTKENTPTTEHSCQTTIEDLNHSNDSQHSFVFEPTEVDYLKQIVLAYMTGTDRITMAKVICAVLRYTDDEKSLIIEHEKLRQSRWLSSSR